MSFNFIISICNTLQHYFKAAEEKLINIKSYAIACNDAVFNSSHGMMMMQSFIHAKLLFNYKLLAKERFNNYVKSFLLLFFSLQC